MRLSPVFLFAGLIAFALLSCGNETPAAEQTAIADEPPPVNQLSVQADAIEGMKGRPLNNEIYLNKLFVQNDRILRYQVQDFTLEKNKTDAYTTFNKRKTPILAAMAADPIAADVLRASESIYVDVYDTDSLYLFSYDLKPDDIFGADQ